MTADQPPTRAEVTSLLGAVRDRAVGAEDALLAAVYADLRELAAARVRREAPGRTLQATALVHEAWLRLRGGVDELEDRRHFFGAAARVMRQILVERHRRSQRLRHGGEAGRAADFDVVEFAAPSEAPALDLVALDGALVALEQHDERMAQIVQLRFFAGLSVEETADVLAVSPRTVKREWAVARAWLYQRMA